MGDTLFLRKETKAFVHCLVSIIAFAAPSNLPPRTEKKALVHCSVSPLACVAHSNQHNNNNVQVPREKCMRIGRFLTVLKE